MAADRQTLLPGPRQAFLLLANFQSKEAFKKTVKNQNRFTYWLLQPEWTFNMTERILSILIL